MPNFVTVAIAPKATYKNNLHDEALNPQITANNAFYIGSPVDCEWLTQKMNVRTIENR